MAIALMRRVFAAVTATGVAALMAIPASAQDALRDLPRVGVPVDGGMGFHPAASSLAVDQQWLDDFVLVIIAFVTAVVCLLLLFCIFRFNSRANPVPARFTHNTPLEITWTLVPVLILVADVIGRVIAPPAEVQVGVMTALIGVPVFILLIRSRRQVGL